MIDQQDTETSTSKISVSEKGVDENQVSEQEQALNDTNPPHPRNHLPPWKWKGTLVVIYMCCILVGYDISNVANIQPRLYEAFGRINLLPWIGLSYSLANFCLVSLARKLLLKFDMRIVFITVLLIFIAGSAIGGTAQSMTTLIVGRIIMGVGGSLVQQSCYSYIAVFARPAEMTRIYGQIGGIWALGLILGGPIGSAFAENDSTTWRWAFFINIPFTGLCFAIALICLPSHMMTPGITLVQRIRQLDPIGIILHIASGTLFAVALTFSGSVWKWGSGPDIAVWVVFGVVFISWGLQQYFCIFTTKDERSLPLHILSRTELVPIWISCLCAGIGYAISLFYTPLFFAFAKGYDAMEQTVRLLPFILPFIACVAITGRILPKIGRYFIIFIVGGAITLAGGAVMANILRVDTPQSHILGIEALIGIGVGMTFQHGIAISNVINKDSRDRVDSLAICNLCQMAGISLMLAVAGSVYQNVGYSLLLDALGEEAKKYSEKDIHEALAGVSSRIWESRDPNVVRSGIQAVATVLAREFYIIAAFGAGSFICGFFMKWERLDFGQEEKAQDDLET